jgi:hypothetical protein
MAQDNGNIDVMRKARRIRGVHPESETAHETHGRHVGRCVAPCLRTTEGLPPGRAAEQSIRSATSLAVLRRRRRARLRESSGKLSSALETYEDWRSGASPEGRQSGAGARRNLALDIRPGSAQAHRGASPMRVCPRSESFDHGTLRVDDDVDAVSDVVCFDARTGFHRAAAHRYAALSSSPSSAESRSRTPSLPPGRAAERRAPQAPTQTPPAARPLSLRP